jgi:hypothetical protein
MLLEAVPEYERQAAFNASQPLAALWSEYLNAHGGKRPPKKREGEPEEPPLLPHERYGWLDVIRLFSPWALPEDLRVPKPEVTPAIAQEVLEAIERDWVPAWVRKHADVRMLEAIAGTDEE